jgi:hypothetical protein
MNRNGETDRLLTSNPKLLVGILACHHRAPHLQACRDTWIAEVKNQFDYKFFFGRGSHDIQFDEIFLESDDAYRGLACKVRAAIIWALENNYDSFFKLDDDTYTIPERLLKAVNDDWGAYDFVGRKCGPTDRYHEHAYARGGTGYYLSRRAMEVIAKSAIPNPDIASEYAEDSFIGLRLKEAGIECTNDDRLRCAAGSGPNRTPRPNGFNGWKADCPTKFNNYITVCEFLGSEMISGPHREWVVSNDAHSTVMGRLRLK